METTTIVQVSIVGEDTGNPYNGKFKVKTLLTRRDHFVADERRRILVGANAASVANSVNAEAFMMGQLVVRIVEAPKWWTDSDGGLDLEDSNLVGELFSLVMKAEEERKENLKKESGKAMKRLSKPEVAAQDE